VVYLLAALQVETNNGWPHNMQCHDIIRAWQWASSSEIVKALLGFTQAALYQVPNLYLLPLADTTAAAA